jgi:hypothetical protein
MATKKGIVVIGIVVLSILAVSIGGVVLAQDDESPTLWDRVTSIYEQITGNAVDQGALKEAFAQAREDIRTEAMENRLQNLVEDGVITQQEADEYFDWWQLKPDVNIGFGFGKHGMRGCGPGLPD